MLLVRVGAPDVAVVEIQDRHVAVFYQPVGQRPVGTWVRVGHAGRVYSAD